MIRLLLFYFLNKFDNNLIDYCLTKDLKYDKGHVRKRNES